MKIEQFEDKGLSHYSYAILSECDRQIVLIDPARDIEPYLVYAENNEAKIIGVIETHPHADFVSGHLELHQLTGAIIYCSKLVGAVYPHQTFDDGDVISFGKINLRSINTPGHSPDRHCAGGYRSAAGSSIISNALGNKINVYDLGESIKAFL